MKYKDRTLPIAERIEDLLSGMTLEEKAAQLDMMSGTHYSSPECAEHSCSVPKDSEYDTEKLKADFGGTGIGYVHDNYTVPAVFNKLQKFFIENTRLGIPVIFTGEALHGICGLYGTIFPSPLNWGATFDTRLANEIGSAIARETRSLGMHEILAPNLDVAREPRWGRVEETFGEDTFLSSRMAAAVISGEQKGDISRPDAVVAEPKHYVAHGIPEGGTNCSPARTGRREVESCYLPVFEAGIVEGGAWDVMTCYNSIDGDVVSCSEYYLKEILKKRLGLRGVARSDWGAVERINSVHHLVSDNKSAVCKAISNGLDVKGLDMPNRDWQRYIVELVNENRLDIERVNNAVRRVLGVKFALGLFENPYTDQEAYKTVIRCDEHKDIAYRAAKESVVLIKNEGVLPLKKEWKRIALIGPNSALQQTGGYSPIPYGYKIPSVYDELTALLPDCTIRHCDGCTITDSGNTGFHVDGQPHLSVNTAAQIREETERATEIAEWSDVIIFVGGDNILTCGEGRDSCELKLKGGQSALIKKLASLGKPTVLVCETGKPLDISEECELCAAVVFAGYGGWQGAKAIAGALAGVFSPSGRLPVSLPRSSTRIPCYYSMLPGSCADFCEGEKDALYGFGHGLSYTEFEYSPLRVTRTGEYGAQVCLEITNTGEKAGDEVVQLYIDDVESSVVTPPMLLKGFSRISLEPKETKTVEFKLDFDSFKLMNLSFEWVVEPGEFRILVGSSSRDIRSRAAVTL